MMRAPRAAAFVLIAAALAGLPGGASAREPAAGDPAGASAREADAAPAAAPASAPGGGAAGEAASASQQDLERSLRELGTLREAIAAEKLPLARKLAALEERLSGLRRQQDEALRRLDAANLDLGRAEDEAKLRRDEAAYVANLLDEYTRNFESRLGVGEPQRYDDVVTAAKRASEEDGPAPARKIHAHLAVVGASLDRLHDALGGTRFPGMAVDPQGVVTEGRFALIGPVALFAADDGAAAGLALPQTGSSQPAVRPLGKKETGMIRSLVEKGKGLLPLDPTRGAALKDLVQRASLIHIFKKGGPIMWPLLGVSILALATVLERVFFLARERRRRDQRALQELLAAVEAGDLKGAIAIGAATEDFVVRSLGYALRHREKSLPSALMYANNQEIKRFSRGIPILDTSITIAPLLGLLGTVTGMMGSFSLIGGDLGAPAAITGGIAEALIATAFGLGIAIVALIPFNYLNNKVEEARHDLEAAATQLELLCQPHAGPVPELQVAAAGGSGRG
jgi:biopolymer transport protein ExbB